MSSNRPEHDWEVPGHECFFTPVIYFRGSLAEEGERQAAEKYFPVYDNRASIPRLSLVIPRYSALPFNRELAADMKVQGCKLINSPSEHEYVADLQNWYDDIAYFTPETWFRIEDMPVEGPFVMKGATNSMKFEWNTHMFAKDRRAAVEVAGRLLTDSMIGSQRIYGRRYIPLHKLAEGLNGLQVTEEYRFFVLDGLIVGAGFYWSSHIDDLDREYDPVIEVPLSFLQPVIDIVKRHISFFVVDVARTAEGKWIVIELNDGQQSGLSTIDPVVFYKNLSEAL